MKRSPRAPSLVVTGGGTGVVSHLDRVLVRTLADKTEDGIRTGKDCGLGKLPSTRMRVNAAGSPRSSRHPARLVPAHRLGGMVAKAEPKTVRYRLLRTAAHLFTGGRRGLLKIAGRWPCADDMIVIAWRSAASASLRPALPAGPSPGDSERNPGEPWTRPAGSRA